VSRRFSNVSAAEQMAARLDARRIRTGRWIARCPAHADRAPSMTVTEGRDGRILLHCFAGCTLAAILHSAGLTVQQLFAASPAPSPSQLAEAAARRAQQRAAEATLRRRERMRVEKIRLQLRDLDQSARELARTLALLPDETPGAEALTACYHAMLTEQRLLERELAVDTGETE
jgi:hypothetical protein